MTQPFCPSLHRQRGAATMFMALMLILAAGLVLLYTSRGAVMEQRLSANEIRSKQAFAAADAGLEHAFSYMAASGIDHNGDGTPDTIQMVSLANTSSNSAQTASYYQAKYCNPDVAAANPASAVTCPALHTTALGACTAPSDPTDVIVVACGWSDDDTAVHRITQRVGGTPSMAGDVPNPLVTRGVANLLVGGASILNYFNDLTVWSGGSTTGQSMTGKTFLRDTVTYPDASATLDTDNNGTPDYRDTGNSPACNNPPTGYTCSTQGSTMGHDVIMSDTRLSNGSVESFFQMFFGESTTDYVEHTSKWVVDPGSTLSSSIRDTTSIDTIYNSNGVPPYNNIWLEGDVSINGEIGSKDQPVILIVDGSLSIGANTVVNGIVYARDTVSSTGTPTIFGALITGSDANTTGNLKIIYDPFEGSGLTTNGTSAKLQGSWKDW